MDEIKKFDLKSIKMTKSIDKFFKYANKEFTAIRDISYSSKN